MIIKDKKDLFSKKNGKPYIVYDFGEKKYTVWKDRNPEWCNFNIGDDVDVVDEQNGQFWNIKQMTLLEAGKGDSSPVSAPNNPTPQPNLSAVGTVMNISDKPHSYEFGKAGNRHKIYYNTVEELQEHIEMIVAAGLYSPTSTDLEIKPEEFGKDHPHE